MASFKSHEIIYFLSFFLSGAEILLIESCLWSEFRENSPIMSMSLIKSVGEHSEPQTLYQSISHIKDRDRIEIDT